MYNLTHTVNFATKIQNDSSTATDNIFVGSTIFSTSAYLNISGLSDPAARYLMINNIAAADKGKIKKWNNHTVSASSKA
jgi:hypothetical protein